VTEEAHESDGQQAEGEEADWLKQLRKDAASAKTLAKENARLKRGSAMDELGIPKTGPGKLFRDAWDGDPEDRDALTKAAREYELIPAEGETQEPERVAEALDGATRSAEIPAGTGAQPTYEALLGEAHTIEDIERIANNAGVGVPIR
jgi:hypothetical protein